MQCGITLENIFRRVQHVRCWYATLGTNATRVARPLALQPIGTSVWIPDTLLLMMYTLSVVQAVSVERRAEDARERLCPLEP